MMPTTPLRFALLVVGTLLVAACGSDLAPPAPPTIERFEVTPVHLEEPGEVMVRWVVRDATTLEIRRGDQAIELGTAKIAAGEVALELAETTTFTIEARNTDGSVTATQTVIVDPLAAPSIATFEGPDYAEVGDGGLATATLRWAGVARATSLHLQAPGQDPIELDASAAEGSEEVSFNEDTTFLLVAANATGETVREATVRVAFEPVIEGFLSDRARIGLGEAVTVEWSTTAATHVELWEGSVLILEAGPTQGSHEVTFSFPTTLELRAFNEVDTFVSATLDVDVGAPEMLTLEASPEMIWVGESLDFEWTSIGGSSLEILLEETGETVCEVEGHGAIAASSCEWQPAAPGHYPVTFRLSNESGVSTTVIDVYAADGPMIIHFGAGPLALTVDEEVEVSWTVMNDPAGNPPTLQLTDDRGNTYPLPAAEEGLYTTTLHETGAYELRLTATTDDPRSTANIATVEVFVHPRPELNFVATPEVFDDSLVDEVTLSWSTRNADTLILYRLEGENWIQVLEVQGDDREAGSYSIVPTEVQRYQLVATNTIGGQIDQEVEITLAPTQVLSFTAEPTSFTQGQEITLRWTSRMADELKLNVGTKQYLLEETNAPYLDLPAMGGAHVPLTDACGGLVDTHGCARIEFPSGFEFPFGNTNQRDVWVHTPGYLSFATKGHPSETVNTEFPTETSNAMIAFAPFWDSMGWSHGRYPSGNIHTALLEEDGEPVFVIQWKDLGYSWISFNDWRNASFNFEVVLRKDGSFDYRYGAQSANGTTITPSLLEGSSATIGFQLPDQSDHANLVYNGVGSLNGPRDHRTFSYRPMPPLPPSGELSFHPFGPQTNFPITLTASRGAVSHSASVNLTVARKPVLELTPETLPPVNRGEVFPIGWKSFHTTRLEVLDAAGQILCTVTDPAFIEEGICEVLEDAAGRYAYTVRAEGANGVHMEKTVEATVFGDFGVISFTTPAEEVDMGSDVLLQWRTFATESVTLFAGGVEVYRDESGTLDGSFLFENIGAATEFRLVAANDVGATDEATLQVGLWPFTLGLQASTDTVRPGDPIDVTLNARLLDGGDPVQVYGMLPIVEDTDPLHRYTDIAELPGSTDLAIHPTSGGTIVHMDFPEGFTFTYMGEVYDRFGASVAGYITFTPGVAGYSNNQALPTIISNSIHVHIAPFWDALNPRNVGKMHTALIDEDTFVIQWSKMSMTSGSNNANPHNLNFQLVLHRGGVFEFRYGAMEGHTSGYTHTSGCFPLDCVNEANGSAATIGYQVLGGTAAHTFHFGGLGANAANQPVPGGLSNRTFRYPATAGSGSFTLNPNQSETYSLCVDLPTETICRELSVHVPFGFSSVQVTNELLAHGGATTLSWSSVGGKSLRILDGDREVYETTNLSEIDQGSISLSPTRTTRYEVELRAGSRHQTIQKLVEVERITISASVTPSSGPGTPVTLSWTLNSQDPDATFHLLPPLEEISNEDFDLLDISYDPDAALMVTANNNARNDRHEFTDGFTFPYFGTTYDFIHVGTDGYLSFTARNTHPLNQHLPVSTGGGEDAAIVPFWDDLHSRVSGQAFAKRLDEDRYVIQWTQMSIQQGSSNSNEGDLNFMVVLYRDGRFDLRYGRMQPTAQCAPVVCEQYNGSSATIGYQIPGGAAGHTLHFGGTFPAAGQPTVPGGISSRAWRFTPQSTSGPGSIVVRPIDTTLYKVCAYATDAHELICSETVQVDLDWGIDLFQANPVAPLAGEPVTLSWSVRNLDSLRVLADGAEIASHAAPTIPLLGSVTHTPNASPTTYTIEGVSSGQTVSREVVVQTRTFDLEVTGPTGTFFPGQNVAINWVLTKHVPDDVIMITPMSEVELQEGSPDGYLDISQFEGAAPITLTSIGSGGPFGQPAPDPRAAGRADVEIPFTFPYLGAPQETLKVYADGYISFASGTGNSSPDNVALPNSGSGPSSVHMAVFWDDLNLRGGSMWRYAPDANTLILQWGGVSREDGSSEGVEYDLNFQVVLRSDGSFDYRFGTMAPPPPPFSDSACFPENCVNETNGSSATIGYQTENAQLGSTFHVGSSAGALGSILKPTGGDDGAIAFPGGLSNRTFRYSTIPAGSSQIVVGHTSDQQVCGVIGDFIACKSVRVNAVAEAGDLIFTELMIDPSEGVPSQWFELRNVSTRPIDLEGFELRTFQGSHTIQGSLLVNPGGFVTIANSTQVPFTPDYLLGGDIPLGRFQERLELFAGAAMITAATWGIDWQIPRDQVLSLEPSLHQAGVPSQPDFTSWCHSGPNGSPGALGAGCLSPWYVVDPASPLPFIDISTTGARIYDIEGDGAVSRISPPSFPISYFGQSYSRVWVSSKGWVSFSDHLPATSFTANSQTLPRTTSQINGLRGPLLMAFWDHLRCGDSCRVYQEERVIEGEKVLLIQWENFYVTSTATNTAGSEGSITFQVQLWEEGDITVAFGAIHNPFPIGSATWASYQGKGAMVGMEAADPEVYVVGNSKLEIGFEQRTFHFQAK